MRPVVLPLASVPLPDVPERLARVESVAVLPVPVPAPIVPVALLPVDPLPIVLLVLPLGEPLPMVLPVLPVLPLVEGLVLPEVLPDMPELVPDPVVPVPEVVPEVLLPVEPLPIVLPVLPDDVPVLLVPLLEVSLLVVPLLDGVLPVVLLPEVPLLIEPLVELPLDPTLPAVPGEDAAPVLGVPLSTVGELELPLALLEPVLPVWADTKVAAAARDTAAATARRLGRFFIEDSCREWVARCRPTPHR